MTVGIERSAHGFSEMFFEGEAVGVLPSVANSDLDKVFASKTRSFREVLAIVVFAMLLEPDYDPTINFYSCHPRPLFEKYIRPVLKDRGVPHGQSGALNIAKAAKGLTQEWATQRRPFEDAQALLRVVDLTLDMSEDELRTLALELGKRFDALALSRALTINELTPVDSSHRLSTVARELIDRYPLGGATPQLLVGVALEAEFRLIADAEIEGARDSVSTTNRTSGKPGDIVVTLAGETIRLYEITVKTFSDQRIDECVHSLVELFQNGLPADMVVIVLCRPQDVLERARRAPGSMHLGELIEGGILFEFIDIYSWLGGKLAELPLDGRRYFFSEVQKYLNNPNIPNDVRLYWASAFE